MDSIVKYAMDKFALKVRFNPNAQGKAGPMARYAQQHPERFQSYIKSLGDSKDSMMLQGAKSQDPAVRKMTTDTFRKGLFAHRTPAEQMRLSSGGAPAQPTQAKLRTGVGRSASARRAELGTSTAGRVSQGIQNVGNELTSRAYTGGQAAMQGIRTGGQAVGRALENPAVATGLAGLGTGAALAGLVGRDDQQ